MSERIEQTLFLIKPDGVERGIIGKILTEIEERGLKIVAAKLLTPSKGVASEHYGDLDTRLNAKGMDGTAIKEQMVNFLTSGPVLAAVIEGVDAVTFVKRLAGATAPSEAELNSIRAKFGHMSREHANNIGKAIRNLVHASDPSEDPAREISLWFKPEEIVNYSSSQQDHTH